MKSEFDRIKRDYNTKELAIQLLQSEGILDDHGELAYHGCCAEGASAWISC